MPPTLATRKPVDALNIGDLEIFPVWTFVVDEEGVDGMDETWVKPLGELVPHNESSITVAAELKLQSGTVVKGLLWCDTYTGFDVHAVAMLSEQGRQVFSRSTPQHLMAARLHELGLEWDQIFPIEYHTRAKLESTGRCESGFFGLPGAASL